MREDPTVLPDSSARLSGLALKGEEKRHAELCVFIRRV